MATKILRNRQGQREYQEWVELCDRIKKQTEPVKDENTAAKKERIAYLLSDFVAFCKYYFPHYLDSEFGWFHIKAAQEIVKDKNCFAILEWAREHAKSVFADVFMPMFLKARGEDEFSGMVIGSANRDKANGLLGDIQAELQSNQRYVSDFGQQVSHGDWRDGYFSTIDGCGFWAFGFTRQAFWRTS
jgi:hypothetical protein